MIETAENLAADYSITREQADAFAARSHRRAAAWAEGRFEDEVVPVKVPQRRGEPILFERDEGIRPDSTAETLGKLRTVTPGGTVTAGNSSQQNDAASAMLIVAEDQLDTLGLEPLGYLTGWAAAGCDPSRMGIGPVPAVERLAARRGTEVASLLDSLDLVELNEAFAVQALSVLEGWGWHDYDKLNVNGSGISLGHPIGATGSRMVTTLLHELKRRGGRSGLATMCIGGGQGLAAIIEAA
jgi:acetyl-CoA C-acetyltransferase